LAIFRQFHKLLDVPQSYLMGFSIRNANESDSCWYAFSPKRGTFFSCLFSKGPFSDRYKTIFSASFSPFHSHNSISAYAAWYLSQLNLHNGLRSYPILLLASFDTSCWYWPTPIAFDQF
jgi:hypothetical protein